MAPKCVWITFSLFTSSLYLILTYSPTACFAYFFFLLLIYFYFFYKLKNIWLFLFFLFLYFNCTLHFCFMISLKTTLFHDAGVSESLTVEVSASVLLAWLFPYPRIHEHKFQGNSRGAEAPEVRKTTRLAIFFPSILKVML